jgi:hypothetical protein
MRRVGKGALAPCPPFYPRREMVGTLRFAHPTQSNYIGRYARTSAGTLTPSLIWPTDLMMSSPSSCAKQA